jgi:hypothetical protein
MRREVGGKGWSIGEYIPEIAIINKVSLFQYVQFIL